MVSQAHEVEKGMMTDVERVTRTEQADQEAMVAVV